MAVTNGNYPRAIRSRLSDAIDKQSLHGILVLQMYLYEWQIWHTHSTYFVDPIGDLVVAAESLVEHGLAKYCFVSNGLSIWVEQGELVRTRLDLSMDSRHQQFNIAPNRIPVDGYIAECQMNGGYNRLVEIKQFGQTEALSAPYLRAYLGACTLVSHTEQHIFDVYPVVKLYESGCVLVELLILGGDETHLETFINSYVRMSQVPFDEVWVYPELLDLLLRASFLSPPIKIPLARRREVQEFLRLMRRRADEASQSVKLGPFQFQLIPLWNTQGEPRLVPRYSVSTSGSIVAADLTHHILFAMSLAMSDYAAEIPLWSRWAKKPLRLGRRWSSRPHIHILSHDNQVDSADENSRLNRVEFEKIYRGVYVEWKPRGDSLLPVNRRYADDYSAHVGNAGSLWVWAHTPDDVEHYWLRKLYAQENQHKAELLEYGISHHHQLIELQGEIDTPADMLSFQGRFLTLRSMMETASHYGETQSLLENGWNEMGLERLQSTLKETSRIAESQLIRDEQLRARRWELVLLIVFGLLAVPTVASEVVGPAWRISGIAYPSDPDLAALSQIVIAIVAVAAILGFFYRVIFGQRRG